MLTTEERKQFLNLFDEILNSNMELNSEIKFAEKGDDVDILSLEREKALSLKLNGRNLIYLKKIQEAKNKLMAGEFGICEDCGAQISLARLKARPTAHLCIVCKEEEERKEAQIIHFRKNDNTLNFNRVQIQPIEEKEIESIKAVSTEEFEEAGDF